MPTMSVMCPCITTHSAQQHGVNIGIKNEISSTTKVKRTLAHCILCIFLKMQVPVMYIKGFCTHYTDRIMFRESQTCIPYAFFVCFCLALYLYIPRIPNYLDQWFRIKETGLNQNYCTTPVQFEIGPMQSPTALV